VFEPTGSQRDAASTLLNLSDYRVIDVLDLPDGARRVEVEATSPPGCPVCGVISIRVHSRRRQRIRDIPVAGALELIWRKRRWFCDEEPCVRGTFAESTLEVPPRSRSTARLRGALVAAVASSGRAVSETASAHGVSWWLVQAAVTAAARALPDVADRVVKHLGVDEHRFRSVRFFRTETGAWTRYEPWMSTIVDVTTGLVLGVVDGRNSAGVGEWLAARPASWLAAGEIVAIDPSATFRKALRTHLPTAGVSVDPFHLVQLGNATLTAVRQRLVRDQKGRRGRGGDPSWAHRQLLLRGADTLSERGWARLDQVFRDGDPTDELSAAWGVKEQLRILLKTTTLAGAHEAKMLFGHYVQVANMPETDRLWNTICDWWNEIETLLITGVTNARTEAANTTIKNIKRTGRGFRNQDNYRSRILLNSAAKRAA